MDGASQAQEDLQEIIAGPTGEPLVPPFSPMPRSGDATATASLEQARPRSLSARLRHLVGLDRAIGFTLLARGWASLSGLATLALIARYLNPAEQGYYYTFGSLVATQIIFELGFSVVILQNASHEAAHLTLHDDGSITGPPRAHARLASVFQKSMAWYSLAALLMAAALLPAGIYFFRHSGNFGISWLLPWTLVVLASSCTFQIDPTFSFLEGCGYVSQVARVRFLQAVLGTCLAWVALLLHHGLYAPGLIISGQAIAGAAFLLTRRKLLLPLLRHKTGEFRIHWGKEVWPFQWRIAVSWICGYFVFYFFNPILFRFRGPVEAGQMGMTINIAGTLSAVAISWMNTKASPFGQLIARREFPALDRLFFRTLVQSVAVAVACSLGLWLAVVYLNAHHVAFAGRMLAPLPLAMMLASTVVNVIIFAEALYLRAHKQEKFMVTSIIGALYMIPAAYFIGRAYGAFGIAAAYCFGDVCIGLWMSTYLFLKYRRLWHAPGAVQQFS